MRSSNLVAEYQYDGLFRRIKKAVTNTGGGTTAWGQTTVLETPIQLGDRTEEYYYAGWSVVEQRNGSNQTLSQWVWGTQYIDDWDAVRVLRRVGVSE